MAIEIKHKFQTAVPDGADGSVVRPSNWNDTHNIEMAGLRLLGRSSSGIGAAQEVALGNGLEFSSGNLVVRLGTGLSFSSGVIEANGLLPISGGTLTGFMTLHANPTSNLHAATKQYVDGILPDTVSQTEAEAGTSTTPRLWTSQRVKQAVLAGAPAAGSTANLSTVSQSEAEAGTSTTVRAWNALRVKQAALAAAPVGVYTGTSANETNLPIGHHILADMPSGYNRNAGVFPSYVSGSQRYGISGTALAGTWRARGCTTQSGASVSQLLQRVA